jgi:hypothetical protein
MIGKEILHFCLVCRVRKISHKKLLHFKLLPGTGDCSRETPGGTERQDRRADGDSNLTLQYGSSMPPKIERVKGKKRVQRVQKMHFYWY